MRRRSASKSSISSYANSDISSSSDSPPPTSDAKKPGKKSPIPIKPIKDIPLGSVSEFKKIYKEPRANDSPRWLDKCPSKILDAVENDRSATYAVVIRQMESKDPGRKLDAHSIVIQSPSLQTALLDHVFNGYPGVTPQSGRLIIEAPFGPFLHRWSKVKELRKSKDLDKLTKDHLSLVYDFMIEELKESLAAHQMYSQTLMVPWKDLWMVFEPGKILITPGEGFGMASEIQQVAYGKEFPGGDFCQVAHSYVDWNGKVFGNVTHKTKIYRYSGSESIESHQVVPLNFSRKQEETRDLLVKRGEKFESLSGYHYMNYNGPALTWKMIGNERQRAKIHVEGRVIIDVEAYHKHSGTSLPQFNPRMFKSMNDHKRLPADETSSNTNGTTGNALSPSQHLICNDCVCGYSPKLHIWLEFYVDFVSDIKWRSKAFENLVIPKPEKDLLLAVSRSQSKNKHRFDDFIEGKGQGFIALLSGTPGTGKTLTAEAVAEQMQVPLNIIKFANLGSNTLSIERELSKIFELASHWNAVLLLDECDVFLEARSPDRLDQNNVVSIFLHALEYYKGILFMTTNRRDNMDHAVASRIHISIEYPRLDHVARRQVWNNLLSSSKSHKLSESDVTELSQLQINGRQIKNILRVASILAADNGQRLKREFIDTVLTIEKLSMPNTSPSKTSTPGPSSDSEPSRKRKNAGDKHKDKKLENETKHSKKRRRTD